MREVEEKERGAEKRVRVGRGDGREERGRREEGGRREMPRLQNSSLMMFAKSKTSFSTCVQLGAMTQTFLEIQNKDKKRQNQICLSLKTVQLRNVSFSHRRAQISSRHAVLVSVYST